MAEAWPSRLIAHRLDFYLQKNTTRYPSPITKTVQTLDRQGRRWIARLVLRGKGRKLGQYVDALIDRGDTFLIWDMRRPRPLNGIITGVQLSAAHLRGNTTIAVDGLPPSQTHLITGDYVGIDSRLYRLLEDVEADGAGAGVFELNRGLLADAADNAAVTLRRPTCEMFIASDDASSSPVDASGFHEYEIPFEESL